MSTAEPSSTEPVVKEVLQSALGEANSSTVGPAEGERKGGIFLGLAKALSLDEREVNAYVNAGALLMVGALILTKLVTVDLDAWRGWEPSEILFRIPIDNWQGYMDFLTSQPIVTKALTSFSVYLIGDLVAQTSEGKTLGELDRGRVARSAIAGLVGHGPLSHFWYEVCEGFFGFLGLTEWWAVFPKIGVDQLLWSPIWNGVYIALLGAMKRDSFGTIVQTVRETAVPLVTSGLKLWPMAHLITYGLIPVENRLLWVDTVEILWVVILSRQAAQAGGGGHGVPPTLSADTEALEAKVEEGSVLVTVEMEAEKERVTT